ncbi:MAG TPA: TPM domain-containing protein, partial [Puia sp.]|nr:TPM domain-containing protein [Puia sp.]
MKKFLLILVTICGFLSRGPMGYGQQIPAKPNPPQLVNDLAHVMTPDQEATLEAKLKAYDDSTSNQISVITVP